MGKLRFRQDARVETFHGQGLLLLAESGYFFLPGKLFEALTPFLTGKYSEEEIVDRLEKRFPLVEIYYALELLKKNRHIIEEDSKCDPAIRAYWNSLGISSTVGTRKISSTRIAIHALGKSSTKEVASALKSLGIRIHATGFPLMITDDYLQADLRGWNARMLRNRSSWMLLKPVGNTIWIGPIFRPGETGCWLCMAQRIGANRMAESFVKSGSRSPVITSISSLEAMRQVAANLAALEIMRWIAEDKNDRLLGAIVTFDLLRLETHRHILTRRPQCPACGDNLSQNKTKDEMVVQSRLVSSNTCRSLTAGQTIERLSKHVSPIIGVISHVYRSTPPGIPIHLYESGHNSAVRSKNLYLLRQALRSQTSGKGKTDSEAKAGAMCEAVERFSGNFMGDEPRLHGKFSEFDGKAVHPNDLLLFSDTQYRNRNKVNSDGNPLHFIPRRFDPRQKIDWTPVWSLTHAIVKYVPTSFCYFDYPQKQQETFCLADSNGNAAGNTIEEAILHGFLELIERDAVAIWWYNRLKRPAVDLASFGEPYFDEMKTFYRSIDREFWVLDLTTDLNIPVFAAINRRTNSNKEEIAFGFGAHLDAKIAITRAMTEMPQLMRQPWDDEENSLDSHAEQWWSTAAVARHRYLSPDSSQQAKSFLDYSPVISDDLLHLISFCVKIASSSGMEVLVLDQTRPDVGMPVVKVMVPGLRHFWARFAPGRLYDIPFQQGWIKKRKPESALNKIHLFV
jgi:oxazoline/thiazoline synthase